MQYNAVKFLLIWFHLFIHSYLTLKKNVVCAHHQILQRQLFDLGNVFI